MDRENFFSEWSELHGGAVISGFVKWWLTISFGVVKPLARARVSPNFVTLCGLLLGAITLWKAGTTVALLFLFLSLFADGIDGSLAILSEKTSLWGAHLDSVVDRVVEFFWAITFIKIGASPIVIGIAWTAALIQEYARARSAGLGYRSIGVVTISERPVRAIFLAIAMLTELANHPFISLISWLWVGVQLISLVVVLRDSYTALRGNN